MGSMNSRSMWTGGFLLGILLLAVGCGGGGNSTTPSDPLTKKQFIAQAAPICQRVGKARERRIEELGPGALGGSQRELERVLTQTIFPLYQEAIAKMASLNPSKGNQGAVKLVNRLETTLKKAEADPGTLIKHNSFIEVDQAAAKYGLKGCTF